MPVLLPLLYHDAAMRTEKGRHARGCRQRASPRPLAKRYPNTPVSAITATIMTTPSAMLKVAVRAARP